jgi:hypothetical protein
MATLRKPWKVTNQHGLTWNTGFLTEEAAWNRVMNHQRLPGETDKRCKARLTRKGWKVVVNERAG